MTEEVEIKISKMRARFNETEIKVMEFIEGTLELEETKYDSEMIKAVASLLSALKEGHYG